MINNYEYTPFTFHPKNVLKINHVGLIPDGTGRWAKREGKTFQEGYLISSKKTLEFIDLAVQYSIRNISIYGSSIQNYKRTPERINAFSNAQRFFLENLLYPKAMKKKWRIRIIGNFNILPLDFQIFLENIQNKTSKYDSNIINFLIAYSPFEEITFALMNNHENKTLIENLWVNEPLDLVIRTGNANLLSNFLPLQAGYARLYFIRKLFPNVIKSDYQKIINNFQKLNRKFGD